MRIGNYIKIGTFIIIGIFVFPYVLCAQNGYYFFSDSDKVAIRNSANTLWGSVIVESMKEKVKERRSHKMEVPLLEGGHLHDYFCPVHNLSFSFEWDKPNEHYCSACKKYWKGNKRYDWAWINKVHAENLVLICIWRREIRSMQLISVICYLIMHTNIPLISSIIQIVWQPA